MSCGANCQNSTTKDILVGNTLFKCNLVPVNQDSYDLVATPCNIPTSIYCVARITKRENCCNNMEYYQSFINTDPVEIIQDCNLEDTIERSIIIYFDRIPNIDTNSCQNRCCNKTLGLF